MNDLSKSLGELLISVLVVVHSIFAWAFVVMLSYGWFILPLNLIYSPTFTYSQFVGLMLFISTLFHSRGLSNLKEEYQISKAKQYGNLVLSPWITLLVVYLVHLFL